VLQRGVGEQLIACECTGWTLASQLTPATVSKPTSKFGAQNIGNIPFLDQIIGSEFKRSNIFKKGLNIIIWPLGGLTNLGYMVHLF
jgi:hypothetical protein